MGRRVVRVLLGIGLVVGLVDLYRSDRLLFRYPEALVKHAELRLSKSLREQAALDLLYTADDAPGHDWVSGKPVEFSGTVIRPGRFGRGLAFDGSRRTHAVFPLRWSDLGDRFTLTLWVRLDAKSADQEILFTRERAVQGFKLDRGALTFFWGTEEKPQGLAYPFTRYGKWVHLAAVVDAKAGRLQLYEDGQLRAASTLGTLNSSESRMALGRGRSTAVTEPLSGEVDEVMAWRKPLSGSELAELAERRKSALEWLRPLDYRIYRMATGLQSTLRQSLKLVDLFNPVLHPARARQADWPEVHLVLSKADARYFARAHQRSLLDGRLDDAQADGRRIDLLEQGRGLTGTLHLDGANHRYADSPRPSYVLEPAGGERVLGLARLRLMPPETAGWMAPLLETRVAREVGAPTISNGLCRLVINGEFKGLYYYEDYAQLGVPIGFGSRRVEGNRGRDTWLRVGLAGYPPITREALLGLLEEKREKYRQALVRDPFSPLSGREIQYRLRQEKRAIELWPLDEVAARKPAVDRLADLLTAFHVLGSNRSPDFLTTRLDLPASFPGGLTVEWESSDPSVLTAAGEIRPPADGNPRRVTLTGRLQEGDQRREVVLDFRVMPASRKLAAIFLTLDESLDRIARRNAAVEYLPAGAGLESQRWLTAGENRSGVSWRGHTSMNQPKKPVGLRLPVPHGWWGTTNVVKVNLINPFRDPTFLRNRLCYDLFRRFPATGRPRDGLPVTWMEVFVNGKYRGLYEASPPVRAEWLGLPTYADGEEHPTLIYKAQATAISLSGEQGYMMRQTEPSRRHGHWPEPAVELLRFLEHSTTEEFVRELPQRMEVDNLIDFHLLLSFTENYNGWPFKFTIHDILVRPEGAEQKFFLVPFDFDTTWDPHPVGHYYSKVFGRLQHEYPGYRQRLARRWFELRKGPLDLAAIQAELLANRDMLQPYVAFDDQHWEIHQGQPYAMRVDQLLGAIRRRFGELDGIYAGWLATP